MSPATTLLAYFLGLNFLTLFTFWLDKRRTRAGKKGIAEGSLLLLVVLGGTIGAWRAMSLYNIKARNHKFRRQFGVIAFVQLCAALVYFYAHMPQSWKDAMFEALNI